MEKSIVYSHHSNQLLEKSFYSDRNLLEGQIDWGYFTKSGGWPNTFVHELDLARQGDVYFRFSLGSIDWYFEQYAAFCALMRYGVRNLKVVFDSKEWQKLVWDSMLASLLITPREILCNLLLSVPTTMDGKTLEYYVNEKNESLTPIRLCDLDTSCKEVGRKPIVKGQKPVICYCPNMTDTAYSLCDLMDLSLHEISYTLDKNNIPIVKIDELEKLDNQDVVFLAKFENTFDAVMQNSIFHFLQKNYVNSFHVVLPYYPVGTMERVDEDKEGTVATAMSMARMLSAVPRSYNGNLTRYTMFDIHALGERFYFSDNVFVNFRTAISLLLERLKKEKDEFAIVFPDEGAKKRFGPLFPGFEKIICEKVRNGEKRFVTIKEGDPQGKHCVIVDDIFFTGGTTEECRVVLVSAGAKLVSLYITHGACLGGPYVQADLGNFNTIWTTDSCQSATEADGGHGNVEVLTVAPLIKEEIIRLS